MKLNRLIPLILILCYTTLFAGYSYNIYPQSSGIIEVKIITRSNNSITSKTINEDNSIKLSFGSIINGNISLKVNVNSKYALQHPTLLLLDSNGHIIAYKQYSDKSTYLSWTIDKSYLSNGTHNYTLVYATNNNKYNLAFYFKTIQITKTFIKPVITQIRAASNSNQNSNEGFVGSRFTFVSTLSEPLPSGYKMYISFEGVTNNGSNSGYYGTPYPMIKQSDKAYYYEKVIQKAGNNRQYKIMIKNSNGQIINSKIGSYAAKSKTIKPVIDYLDKSSVLNKLDLGVPSNKYTHFSRAEASIILYEFLKLKDPNFALPYGNIGFYKNPFADIDPNSAYYRAVITLANYKGSDNITVLTDKYGVFNPLENITRFQFVKMIVEGLNLKKSKDFSNIRNFDDYNKLANDAKAYYSTAVKYGLIKGDNNKLLPYNKLTMFQALTILGRALDISFTSSKDQFNMPDLTTGEIGNPLGNIPENQDYDPTVTPIKITNIASQKDGNCSKLTAVATLDPKAKGKEYYVWSANFGYFKKITPNNKEVLFCPSTKEPNVNYKIHLLGNDGYMNFATFNKNINKSNYEYVKNISNTNPSEVKLNLSLSIKTHLMQENHLFVISKSGSLYEHNLNIGLEKVAVTLQNEDGKTYTINNVKWNNHSIYFIVPSVKDFYGKFVTLTVDYGTNDTYKAKTFNQIMYKENFIISGTIQPDKIGNYPKYVTINSKQVAVTNGKFLYFAPDGGNYKISADKNYQTVNITLTDQNPRPYVYINYAGLDYANNIPNITTGSPQTTGSSNKISSGSNITTGSPQTTGSSNKSKEIALKKGWNLISANINLNNIPKSIKYIWQYKQGQWFAYSPLEKIQDSINASGMNAITSINADEGTWVYSTKRQNLQIRTSQLTTYNYSIGWTLAGTNRDLDVNKIICEDGSQPKSIWEFKDNKWLLHTTSNNKTYSSFDSISANNGFWINCK